MHLQGAGCWVVEDSGEENGDSREEEAGKTGTGRKSVREDGPALRMLQS